MNIAIVEDDLIQRTALSSWLEEAGHHCHGFGSGDEFERSRGLSDYQLLLFDWELPGMSGIELLDKVRMKYLDDTPVIFITTHGEEAEIVQALRSGADDYMVKPARRQELLARIEAVARRSPRTEGDRYGRLQLLRERRQFLLDGKPVELTHKEYALACFLLQNTGRLLSRTELLEGVWGLVDEVHTRTIDTHISRLRKKLQLNREHGWNLGSVYQYGYRLDRLGEGGIALDERGGTLSS